MSRRRREQYIGSKHDRQTAVKKFTLQACTSGKRGFESKQGARRTAKRVQRMGGDPLCTYVCVECGMWHAGHLPPAVKRGEVGRREFYDR